MSEAGWARHRDREFGHDPTASSGGDSTTAASFVPEQTGPLMRHVQFTVCVGKKCEQYFERRSGVPLDAQGMPTTWENPYRRLE